MDRNEQTAKRLRQMPRNCRSTYEKAVKGKSLRAGANSFCFECMGYQREEVKICTDLGCPLYPYRPTTGITRGRGSRAIAPQTGAKPEQMLLTMNGNGKEANNG